MTPKQLRRTAENAIAAEGFRRMNAGDSSRRPARQWAAGQAGRVQSVAISTRE